MKDISYLSYVSFRKRIGGFMGIISYISLNSSRKDRDSALFGPVAIFDSQPTRCGHTLRGVHFRGLASACRPSNPAKAKRHKP